MGCVPILLQTLQEFIEYNMDRDKVFCSPQELLCPIGLGILYNRTTQLGVSVPKAQQSGQSINLIPQEGKVGKENTNG